MVEFIETKTQLEPELIQGLSTDTKPLVNESGLSLRSQASFLELDTGTTFIFSNKNINPATLNGWWEMI